jgi:hypothetical protein
MIRKKQHENITDRLLLKYIYEQYYPTFCSFDKTNQNRSTKMYVPIDCESIAKKFNLDPHLVFGRLYFHLDKKYGYTNNDGTIVPLFALKIADDRHVVNFPLLSAIVAELDQSFSRFSLTLLLSSVAILISIISIFLQYF